MNISTSAIDHLGLVAGIFDKLGIAEVIDKAIPKTRKHKVSHSDILKALVLNGLGFVDRRLYIFPDYIKKLAIERLFGKGITAQNFNDDATGRSLDQIFTYGPTKLFNEIALKVMENLQLGTQLVHVDTTSFSVHGEYEGYDGTPAIEIVLGHPKDGRWDLKQFVLAMVSNQHGMPLFVQAHSGNKSDKKSIMESIQYIRENLDLDDKVIYVADSAFFTANNIKNMGQDCLWITRVPSTLKKAKDLLKDCLEMKPCADDRYTVFETIVSYADIDQKWVVVDSKDLQKKKAKTFEKNLKKERSKAKSSLKKLKSISFACEADAIKAANRWIAERPRFLFKNLGVETVQKRINGKRGRPRNDEILEICYFIKADIELNQERIEDEQSKLGRFILASNDTEIEGEQMLQNYKGQISVERGFRFLKDKQFLVAEVYLKKNSRIEALAMVMVLCLLVYSIAEWILREKLAETGETVLNQLGKPTQRPTLKWVFSKFSGVNEATAYLASRTHIQVTNLNDELRKIIRLLGQDCEKYYA